MNLIAGYDRQWNSRVSISDPSQQSCEVWDSTGSPSSKYEHRRATALLRNIQNIRTSCVVHRLFTVPNFFVRSFRYTASSYRNGYLDFKMYRGGGRWQLGSFDTHARWVARNAKLSISMILRKNRRLWTVYVVHGSIYGHFMGFYVNGFLSMSSICQKTFI